jgi:hypothetical protein
MPLSACTRSMVNVGRPNEEVANKKARRSLPVWRATGRPVAANGKIQRYLWSCLLSIQAQQPHGGDPEKKQCRAPFRHPGGLPWQRHLDVVDGVALYALPWG